MHRLDRCLVVGIASLALTRAASADPWDLATANDDGPNTATELIHGADEQHDLGANGTPDEDWFRVSLRPYSSYEVVVDATGGDIANVVVERMAKDGTTVLQTAVPVGVGHARSLRFRNDSDRPVSNQFIRVRSGSCTSNCGSDDVYRLREYETTYAVPGFNGSASQVTTLLLQNPTDHTITGTTRFWNASGASVGASSFTLAPRALSVLATPTIAPGTTGSMTISHDGRYGELAGKAVTRESATGFSFDTPIVPKIH